MNLSKKVNLIIYRFRERGLEIFLINNSTEKEENWEFPEGDGQQAMEKINGQEDDFIQLDPSDKEDALAVEGDWHDIPSLKSMLFEDAMYLKEKAEEVENGTYVKIKEALKKVLPHQYKFLKELKDILTDRNSVKDL